MSDYDARRAAFDWDDYRRACDWDATERLNLAHEVIDANAGDGEMTAIRWHGREGRRERLSYADLARRSDRFANALESLGVDEGDRVITYLPRIPEHYVIICGSLKTGAIFGAINERYGTRGIEYRLDDSRASVVLTTTAHAETVVRAVEGLDTDPDVVLIDNSDGRGRPEPKMDRISPLVYADLVADEPTWYRTTPRAPDDPAFLYYTSGTTGPAKGVVHGHRLVLNLAAMSDRPIGLREGDLFWCTGDLGWLTGLIPLGGLFHGIPAFVYEGQFKPADWVDRLDEYPISVLFSVPTAYRMLKERDDLFADAALSVRSALSVGEPLNPAVIDWARDRLRTPVLDNYGTSEAFGGVVANFPWESWTVKPGSMGRPAPGVDVDLRSRDGEDSVQTGEVGELAVADYPGRFLKYWERADLTADAFRDGWLLTGDLAERDEAGDIWFQGRADDVIVSSGYRIGPFDIESALVDHEAVAEAAAVPAADETRGNVVKAVVVPSADAAPSADLREDLAAHAKEQLAAHEYPRRFEFVEELPKTVTGKIRRRELRG